VRKIRKIIFVRRKYEGAQVRLHATILSDRASRIGDRICSSSFPRNFPKLASKQEKRKKRKKLQKMSRRHQFAISATSCGGFPSAKKSNYYFPGKVIGSFVRYLKTTVQRRCPYGAAKTRAKEFEYAFAARCHDQRNACDTFRDT